MKDMSDDKIEILDISDSDIIYEKKGYELSRLDIVELNRAFIGKNVSKFNKNGFSFWWLIFNIIYSLYRKMYLFSFILFISRFIISMLLPGTFGNIIIFFSNFIIAITFKEFYLKHVAKKVHKIISKNATKSFSELKDMCEKKGGCTITGICIFIIFLILAEYILLKING